jgi:hypothetical protein
MDSSMKNSVSAGFGTSTRESFNKTFAGGAVERSNLRSKGGGYSSGPGMYNSDVSSFGPQSKSTKLNATSVGFGVSERTRPKSFTPGPGAYDSRDTVGVNSTIYHAAAKPGFGTASRDQASMVMISTRHEKKQFGGRAAPGPGAYDNPSFLSKSVTSKFSNGESMRIGTTSERFKYNYQRVARENPGVGAYDLSKSQSLGTQAMSTKLTAPSCTFGTVDRDGANKTFMGTRHSVKQFGGKAAPGAGTYDAYSTFGKQENSRCKTAPSSGFGSSARLVGPKSQVPGPGSYCAW